MDFEYQKSGTFNTDNRFVLQRSDQNGTFASFTNVATDLKKTGHFSVKVDTIGDRYRFRVISTSPFIASDDNGTDVRLMEYPSPAAQVWRPMENRTEYVGLVGAPLRFISQHVGGDTVAWTFTPDAAPATTADPNPTVTFTTSGRKSGTLTATNVAGCQTSTSTSVVIAECRPKIPKSARIVVGTETGKTSDSSVLVKTGATFTARGSGPFFVEQGGVIVIGPGQYHTLTYLMNGSSVRIEPSSQAAYFALGSDVVWTEGSDMFDTVRCNDLFFDYSELTSGVSTADETMGRLAPLADGSISWSGQDPVTVEVLNVLGVTVLTTTLESSRPLALQTLPRGAYIIRSATKGVSAIRVVR